MIRRPTRMASKRQPYLHRNKDNELRAVAIHGYGGCPNGAVRFTQTVYDDFLAG